MNMSARFYSPNTHHLYLRHGTVAGLCRPSFCYAFEGHCRQFTQWAIARSCRLEYSTVQQQ